MHRVSMRNPEQVFQLREELAVRGIVPHVHGCPVDARRATHQYYRDIQRICQVRELPGPRDWIYERPVHVQVATRVERVIGMSRVEGEHRAFRI